MATSVLMAATDRQGTNSSLPTLPQDQDHQPIRRSSGRRKPKGTEKKKQPQRGMGVEKLERLRLQERWKKMTEINTASQGFTVPTASFADPTLISASAPLQISKVGGFGAPNVAQMGLNPKPNQIYLQGFQGQVGVGGLGSDHRQLQTDLFGIGGLNDSGFLGKNVNGISKELPSNPNVVKCYSQHCNACHKKKKVNGENLGSGRVRPDMYVQMCDLGDCGFLGLNIGDNQSIINQENQALRTKAPFVPQLGYAVGNGKQGVEVVAVHRKGSSSSSSEGGNHVLMEYDFFSSGRDDCDHHNNDELVMMKLQVGGSQTCSSTASPCSSSMDCIDLSLKLSY
ncbi:hypothetical protein CDL12_04228 [Handroanthus impetiginosus]|uniref:Uncharacterized protein n=1 Tax=Handroanthus impetiginosus TaxID=429701 RepID=A0A2G9HZV4_9LAMI|nr:hypothetical protein CDL12_04228 [Handroanthus impetiginosus]